MYSSLSEALQLPTAYTPSDAGIWTDEHISKQMLDAHLDPDCEGASRSHAFIDRSVAWIGELLPPARYRTLIDIGCGPGLYAERFCRAGYHVTGLDFSRRSIRHAAASANAQGLKIRYLQQDYLQMRLNRSFQLATLIYCDYGALSDTNRAILLGNIHQCLEPGGMLLLDVFSMRQYEQFREAREWDDHPTGGFWSASPYLELRDYHRYGETLTLRQTAIVTERGIRRFCLWDTYFTEESLTREVQSAGFRVCETFGDISGAPYTPDSPTIAVLLQVNHR